VPDCLSSKFSANRIELLNEGQEREASPFSPFVPFVDSLQLVYILAYIAGALLDGQPVKFPGTIFLGAEPVSYPFLAYKTDNFTYVQRRRNFLLRFLVSCNRSSLQKCIVKLAIA
jgi:hypothetical protein